jgi:hypothetical protein
MDFASAATVVSFVALGIVFLALFSRYGLYLYLPLVLLAAMAGIADPPGRGGWSGIISLSAAWVAALPWTFLVLSGAFTDYRPMTDKDAFGLLWSFTGLNVFWALGNAVLRRRAQALGAGPSAEGSTSSAPGVSRPADDLSAHASQNNKPISTKSRSVTASYIALSWLLGAILVGAVFSVAETQGLGGAVVCVSSAAWVGLISIALHCACILALPDRFALSLGNTVIIAVVASIGGYASFSHIYVWFDSFLGPWGGMGPARLLSIAFLTSQIVFWGTDYFLKRIPTHSIAVALGWAVIAVSYVSVVATAPYIWRVPQPERLSEIGYFAQQPKGRMPNSGVQPTPIGGRG